MRLTLAKSTRSGSNCRNLASHFPLVLAVWLAGCNTCFTFTSNPPTGTTGIKVSDPGPTCALAKANGVVRVQLLSEPTCSSCPGSGQVQHIYLSIRSIEVHTSPTADDTSADWQELLQREVTKQTVQVDLLRGTDGQSAPKPLGDGVAIEAGIYRQVRLRLVPDQPAPEDRLPEGNACGDLLFNCVVTEDGRIQPLLFDGDSQELRITPDGIEGGSLLILPDTYSELAIELKLRWAWFSSADQHARLVPSLVGNAKIVLATQERREGTTRDEALFDLTRLSY